MRTPSLRLGLLIFGLALSADAFAEGVRVTGTIRDTNDAPVADLTIDLVPVDYRGQRVTIQTDADGTFRREAVVPAEYYLRWTTDAWRRHGVEAIARRTDGSVAWESAGPLDPAEDPVWSIPDDGNVFLWMTVAPAEGTAEPYVARLPRLTALVQQGRCDEALDGLAAYADVFVANARAQYLLGYCRANGGDLDGALPALERALEFAPKMPGVALLAGQALMSADRTEEAAAWLRREIDADADPDLALEALVALAFLERDAGHDDAALAAFQKAAFLDPERTDVVQELAGLLLARGETDRAVEALEEAAAEGRVDVAPLLNAGIEHFNAKTYADAETLFSHALRLATDDEAKANAHALLGRTQVAAGKTDEGLGHLRTSLMLSPSGKFSSFCRELLGG